VPGVYSERFLTCISATVASTFTVPPGKRAVIRCLTISKLDESAGTLFLSSPGIYWAIVPLQGSAYRVIGDLRCVVYAGGAITLSQTAGNTFSSVHGYLLNSDSMGLERYVTRAPSSAPEPLPGAE